MLQMVLRLSPPEPAPVALPEQRAAPGRAGLPRAEAPARHPGSLAQPRGVRLRPRAEPHLHVPDCAAREGRFNRVQVCVTLSHIAIQNREVNRSCTLSKFIIARIRW